ncbi:MAG: tetratricopeptide repeat protein [Acidobacteriota bacterium]
MERRSIGPYRILGELGSGGMGQVLLAEDTRLGRKVALKRLPDSLVDSSPSRRRLMQEARAVAHLTHPNIAAVHDVIEVDDKLHIVMEYVPGETLATQLIRGPLPPEQVRQIGLQLASALAEAHSQGIIHRDLKPANVALTQLGNVKILDFGLAKRFAYESEGTSATKDPLTRRGEILGTPGYMAPEQLVGKAVDHRCDIYALGVLLFELLTGRRPFLGGGHGEQAYAAMMEPAPRASDIKPGVPLQLSDVVERAMAKEPEKRYAAAKDVYEALASLDDGSEGVTLSKAHARSPSAVSTGPLRRALGRRKASIVVGILAAAVALAVLIPRWIPKETLHPIVAVLPLVNLSGDSSIDHIGVGIAHTLITNLAAIRSVTVVSRSATREYAGETAGVPAVADVLGATHVVNGSVQSASGRLQITLNLVGADDTVIWGETFHGTQDDLFALQRRLSQGLGRALRLDLTPDARRRLESVPTSNREAYAEYIQARAFLERPDVSENTDRAIELFRSATEKDPQFVLAYAGLGEAYWEHYRQTSETSWTDKAREATEEASRLDPDHPAVRYSLAIIYDGTGRSDEAIDQLRHALELQPNLDDAHRLLGTILAKRGDLDEAVEELQEAIALRPNFWGHRRSLGMAYYNAGRYPEAADAFRRVTELQPDLPWGHQWLGVAYHAMGDLAWAVPSYEEAIRLGPSPASYSNLGTIYYRQGKYDEAATAYERAIELNPNSARSHRNLGDAYQRMGRVEDARASYLRAMEQAREQLRVNPRSARSMGALAVYEAKLGRRSEALTDAARAVDLAPGDPETHYQKAVVHALVGEAQEAIQALEEALAYGYSPTEASEDDDFRSLRHLQTFKAVIRSKQ